jgi:hypothetical protein
MATAGSEFISPERETRTLFLEAFRRHFPLLSLCLDELGMEYQTFFLLRGSQRGCSESAHAASSGTLSAGTLRSRRSGGFDSMLQSLSVCCARACPYRKEKGAFRTMTRRSVHFRRSAKTVAVYDALGRDIALTDSNVALWPRVAQFIYERRQHSNCKGSTQVR